MKRRNFLTNVPLAISSVAAGGQLLQVDGKAAPEKAALTVAHITDVHIRSNENIPERFKRCLEEIKARKVDFFLNGGDSIHAADYKEITREQVLEQWNTWDECMEVLKGYEIYSCIGNHDPWWAAPSADDNMYGIDYAVKRAGMPHRYYSFSKENWRFIVLDGNHEGITLDRPQMDWLKNELASMPAGTFALLMSHYPILTVTNTWEGGQHKDHQELKQLFFHHKDKVKVCLSGHQHLLDRAWYNGVNYFCNGAVSGFWWGKGDARSAQEYYYQETPPGYAILRLFEDGSVENEYFIHKH